MTVQEALQWLGAYAVPAKPKCIDINTDGSTVLSNRTVYKLRVYKTGVKVLGFYEDKLGWIWSEDILACADAIKGLQKA